MLVAPVVAAMSEVAVASVSMTATCATRSVSTASRSKTNAPCTTVSNPHFRPSRRNAMRLKCLLSLALVCISVGAADAQTTTFNPSAVPITLDERELQIRVLEGHSRRIAETEREIKELKKKLSTPAVTPKGTPSTKGKKSSPAAVYTPTSTKSFDPISHQQRLRDVINGVPSISAQKTVYQQTQASQSYTVRRGETIEITYPGGGLVQVSVDYSPMRCRTPGGMHLYYAMPD